jgi:uncharacterized membrane protein
MILFLIGFFLATYAITGLWRNLSKSMRGRITLTVFFLFTGLSHFLMTEKMAQMLPPSVPMRTTIIYVTGVLEILGAIGLLINPLQKITAWALIVFLIGVLPANIYAAIAHVNFGGHEYGPAYLLIRVPFQIFLILWCYYFGIKQTGQKRQSQFSTAA